MTKLDLQQIIRSVYDPTTKSLKMSDSSEVNIAIDATEDSVSVRPLSFDVGELSNETPVDVLSVKGYSIQCIPGSGSVTIMASNNGLDWFELLTTESMEIYSEPTAMYKFVKCLITEDAVAHMVTKG